VRIGLYADQGYVSADGAIYASQPFVLFMLSMRQVGEQVILLGRLDPRPASSHYRLPADVEFAPLPWYEQASDPLAVVRTAWRSLRAFWHALDTIDLVLVFGPGPMATAFAIVAKLRGKPVALGVRQDYPAYVRLRHPGRRGLSLAAVRYSGWVPSWLAAMAAPAMRWRSRSRSCERRTSSRRSAR
jgi:hypothetical protein